MMLPFKYRKRQVEQIIFRYASDYPLYFRVHIFTAKEEFVSNLAIEPSIVSKISLIQFLESKL
jgi:hypothetical protein